MKIGMFRLYVVLMCCGIGDMSDDEKRPNLLFGRVGLYRVGFSQWLG